jgi:F420-non-reducing hydrogenase small subunit
VLEAVDIVFWPVALDFKERHVEAMADASIDVAFVNGAVRTTEQLRMARLMRRKSRFVVGFGACAQLGGIPGLSNLTTAEATLEEAYGEGTRPRPSCPVNGYALELPTLFDTVLPLGRAIPVDYHVPGCPPSPKIVAGALQAFLSGQLPEAGAVLAPDHAMCEECPRRDSHPDELRLEHFHRVPEKAIDPEMCILAQGLPCLGPSTRAGCGARCIDGNMPCTGCFGPTSKVRDYGAKALCSIASVLGCNDPAEIDAALEKLADPAGTFYRYSLAASFLERKRMEA